LADVFDGQAVVRQGFVIRIAECDELRERFLVRLGLCERLARGQGHLMSPVCQSRNTTLRRELLIFKAPL
jgi:hypothetical protein